MIAAFTGTKAGMTERQRACVKYLLAEFKVTDLLHGACEGADREVHLMTPDLYHEMYPTTPEQCDWALDHEPSSDRHGSPMNDVHHEFMEGPKPQLSRNHLMVDRCSILIATPKSRVEVLRSGTWATIRYAEGRLKVKPPHKVLVHIMWPDGTFTLRETKL